MCLMRYSRICGILLIAATVCFVLTHQCFCPTLHRNQTRLGMIKSYCHQDVERGIFLLKLASSRGCVRSSYALGLILRDSLREQSCQHLQQAASKGYLPALQELLPAREMKAKYGEPDAQELRRHLDPVCLNRLLGRHYLHSKDLRDVNTSHCWNPHCGRWAFKATMATNGGSLRMRRPFSYAFFRQQGEAGVRPVVPPPRNARTATALNLGSEAARRDAAMPQNDGATRADRVLRSSQPVNEQDAPSPSDETAAGASMCDLRVSRMKMCSRCCRAKYCSKLCQVYDWRSGRHKMECQFL